MKRGILLPLLLAALPAFGLTKTAASHGNRIGILRISTEFSADVDRALAATLQKQLTKELRSRGFEAFDAEMTFEDARREAPNADYFVEIVSGYAANRDTGGAGVGVGHVAVDLSVVTTRVAAELRLYDARTMEMLDRYDLTRRKTTVVPMGVDISTRFLWGFVALPLVDRIQYRSATHAIARDAAERIANR